MGVEGGEEEEEEEEVVVVVAAAAAVVVVIFEVCKKYRGCLDCCAGVPAVG